MFGHGWIKIFAKLHVDVSKSGCVIFILTQTEHVKHMLSVGTWGIIIEGLLFHVIFQRHFLYRPCLVEISDSKRSVTGKNFLELNF